MYSNEKFKRGDYVLRVDGESFKSGYKMRNVYSIVDKESVIVSELSGTWRNEDIRHATQEEIYWMGRIRHGGLERDFVGDLREGDIFIDADSKPLSLSENGEWEIGDAKVWYSNKDFRGLYPAKSFKRYPQEDE